ncbi:MAG: Clp1/GlmU family protein, partial [Methanosarcinales archaeon]
KKMVENANTDFVLIDTTGLIQFTGRALKTYKIEILKPDLIIALQRKDELEPILKPFEYMNIIRLTVSEKANKKGIEARRFLRELSFKKYFEKCKEIFLDLNDLKFLRSYIFSGEEIEFPNFLYTEKIPEGFVVVSDKYTKRPNTLTIQNGFEKNLLVGLMDLKNRVLGLGIIEFIDYNNKKIKILSQVEKNQIKIIIMGGIKIDKNGKEIEKIKPGTSRVFQVI